MKNALDFGIMLRVIAFLKAGNNSERDIMKLLRIDHIHNAGNMANGRKLCICDLNSLWV